MGEGTKGEENVIIKKTLRGGGRGGGEGRGGGGGGGGVLQHRSFCQTNVKTLCKICLGGNCLSGLVTEYPARPRKHQVPCPHRQGVGYGAFCISGTCTSLERCNTLDFVPKSCAKGAAPLWNPCSHRLWAMWIRRTESSHKGAPGCLRRGKGTSAEV